MFLLKKRPFILLCALGIAVNAVCLFTEIMLGDGVLYALIAKNMVVNHEYLFLTLNGMDWLDKPHFPFWSAALSYHIFGINDFAYKFPAFVFWLIGVVYTYNLSKHLYGKKNVAQIAVLIYISTLHLLISNSDVRAEPYLTGMTIAAIFHFYRAYQGGSFWQIVWGALWAAAAVMSKGMFVLIIIASGFVVLWLVRREWKQFLNYRWYLSILLVLVFILPELYSLYAQFDARPEVEVFGRTNVSGIKFFFWDSQFGRFVNSGPIKGKGDPFFYLHTTLWAFLPWSFLLPFLLYFSVGKRKVSIGHPLLWGTVLLTFLMFSASQFQLPHYLNVIFPILSIWLAQLLAQLDILPAKRAIHKLQWYLGALLVLVMCVLTYLFHADSWLITCIVILLIGGPTLLFAYRTTSKNTLTLSFSIGLTIGLFYGGYLYPNLLFYQSGDAMARYLNKHVAGTDAPKPVYTMYDEINNLALGFQGKVPLHFVMSGEQLRSLDSEALLVVHSERLRELSSAYAISVVTSFPDYHVSRIKPRFFYYKTREETLGRLYLVHLKNKQI